MKKAIRFTSEKTAKSFAEKTNGELRDLRNHDDRKSDFKVVYDRQKRDNWGDWKESNEDESHDFDGYTHTADDL